MQRRVENVQIMEEKIVRLKKQESEELTGKKSIVLKIGSTAMCDKFLKAKQENKHHDFVRN